MNAELIEAIRELGKTSPWDIASVVIGIIGTLLTLVVLYYNHKSIKLTQKTMQQAISLQLYEKRLELYSGLLGDNAFEKAPLELKIVFSEKIYTLYAEVAALCTMQINAFYEYCLAVGYHSRYNITEYNVLDAAYNDIISNMDTAIKLLPAKSAVIREYKKEIETIHQNIISKIEILECEMKKFIEESIS